MLETCHGEVSMSALHGSCLGWEVGRAFERKRKDNPLQKYVRGYIVGTCGGCVVG